MAVRTRIQPRYFWQKTGFAILCVVMGLWGVYDYFVAIPAREARYERAQDYRIVMSAVEQVRDAEVPREEAAAAAREALQTLAARRDAIDVPAPPEDADPEAGDLPPEVRRVVDIMFFGSFLERVAAMPPDAPLEGALLTTYESLQARVDEVAKVKRPNTFDRITQLAFISCLPFAFWLGGQVLLVKRRRYVLDDDGTLQAPEGTVAPDDVADIDMSRWFEKSIATLVLTDGRRIKLDDYLHKDMHLIVGHYAHPRYPDQWHEDARKVKPEERGEAPAEDSGDATAEAVPAAEESEAPRA